jgi:ADP-ribose pyrophosphatase
LEERAVKEIEEESGYKVKKEDLESLGTCYGAKSIDTVFHLFAVDVADKEPEEPEGDGSDLEDKSKFEWTYFNKDDHEKFQCSILSTMILRLGFN